MPHTHLSISVEAHQCLVHCESSQPPEKLIEAQKSFTEYVKTLLMREGPDISQAVRDVFCEDLNVFVVRAEVLLCLEVCFEHLHNRLIGHISVIVSLHFLGFVKLRIVKDDMLLC